MLLPLSPLLLRLSLYEWKFILWAFQSNENLTNIVACINVSKDIFTYLKWTDAEICWFYIIIHWLFMDVWSFIYIFSRLFTFVAIYVVFVVTTSNLLVALLPLLLVAIFFCTQKSAPMCFFVMFQSCQRKNASIYFCLSNIASVIWEFIE